MNNTSLISKLYQCYLHALTSHYLPDPLLGHTGTEEALYMLRSASCQSFQRLDVHEAKLLELIGNLTPDRFYYPRHSQSMVAVKWNDLPALSQHHDFFRVVCSLLDHARALEALYDQPAVFDTPKRNELLLNRAASRNELYYPLDLQISDQASSLNDVEYRSRDVPGSESAELVAYQTSWSIWNSQPPLGRSLPKLWDVMCSWGTLGPASSEVSLRYSRYWLECDFAQDWFVIYNLCRRAINENHRKSRFKLSFCLSAAAYSKSKFAGTVPILIISALDHRCQNLNPPSERSYVLPDGVAPEYKRLEDLVFQFALPIGSIPAHFFKATANTKKAQKRRKEEYDTAIRMKSSAVADSILRQWPEYSSANFHEPWFDRPGCLQRIEQYIKSISRNVRLREHVLQLQSILQDHTSVSTPVSTAPYLFSPRFITRHTKSISYSIRDVLLFRTTIQLSPTDGEPFPLQSLDILPAAETEGGPLPVGSDSLRTLIDELRHSQRPLLQLYGNELNESYRELMERSASQSAWGAVPSHELLRLYHGECSHRKDKSFSDILAALAPSQTVEKVNGMAGLWPRITPRSLLRQLAQDRIGSLPHRWKVMITHYALCVIKFQQSRRLLELSSRQKHEELVREIESMRSDVLAESTPDWLLVQVRALRCGRTS